MGGSRTWAMRRQVRVPWNEAEERRHRRLRDCDRHQPSQGPRHLHRGQSIAEQPRANRRRNRPPPSLDRCSKGTHVSHVTRAPPLTLANALRALKRVSPIRLRACLRYRGIGSEMRRRRAGYAEYDRSSPCADKLAAHGETRDERSSR